MKAPIAKNSTANKRQEHNVEKYILLLTTLSLTILVYLHSYSCCCVRNVRNRAAKFSQNSNLYSSRSSKVIDLGVNREPRCDFLLVIVNSSNFGLSSTVFEILTFKDRKWLVFPSLPCLPPPLGEPLRILGMGLPYGENFIILTSTIFV